MNNHTRRLLLSGLLFLLVIGTSQGQMNIFVSHDGDDSNTGTIESPLKTLAGAREKVLEMKTSGIPDNGIVVNFREGRYPVDSTITMGVPDGGTADKPIVYTGYEEEDVIFDGSLFLDSGNFEVTTSESASILHATAVGNVYYKEIKDSVTIEALKDFRHVQLSMDDKMLTLSRFPNLGFATIDNSSIGDQGNEDTPSQIKGSKFNPVGPSFSFIEQFDANKWKSEVEKGDFTYVEGYYTADWLREGKLNGHQNHPNALANVTSDGKIRLISSTRYGFGLIGAKIKRMAVANLLAELDEPGEWHFDRLTNKFYIWPLDSITSTSKIGVWAGPEMLRITDGSHIQFKNMTIQGLAKGSEGAAAISVAGGENILIAGMTFRHIAEPLKAINISNEAKNVKVLSCDFYDLSEGVKLDGGSFTSGGVIERGDNIIENCHFTQLHSKSFSRPTFSIAGVGQTFRNNLIHNTNAQTVIFEGIDHLLEKNEFFNVGVESADVSAIYCSKDLMSHGNVLRHNFIHHNMTIPEHLGKASIFSDNFDGGESIVENVTYKGGWESLKMSGGAGHSTERNVLIDAYIGIRQDNGAIPVYETAVQYIKSDNMTSNDKANYIGRTLMKIGVDNWHNGLTEVNWYDRIEPAWKERYPKFDKAMKAYLDNKQMNAYECLIRDNLFSGSVSRNIFAVDRPFNGVIYKNAANIKNNRSIDLNVFENPDNLNFQFKSSAPSYAPNIPFEQIGMYSDEYRCEVPNKNDYRRNVKQHFEGQPAHTFQEKYDPETVNDRIYFNSGKMVFGLLKCGNVFSETEYRFDMGTATSKVASGYSRVSNKTYPGAYGWTAHDTIDLRTIDRGGENLLTGDMIFSSEPATFEVALANGVWDVSIVQGDLSAAHDSMQVVAEGKVIENLKNLSTAEGEFNTENFQVNVSDGRLDLEFSDNGGNDPLWVVNGIELKFMGEDSIAMIEDMDSVVMEDKDTILVDEMDSIVMEDKDTVLVDEMDSIAMEDKDSVVVDKEDVLATKANVSSEDRIVIYPSPVHDVLKVKLKTPGLLSERVEILNETGQILMTTRITNYEINLSKLPPGVYLVKMKLGSEEILRKFIKE